MNAYLGFYCDQDWFDANGVALPTSWNDLLDERLKDNVVITNPGTSTTGYMMLSTLCQLMGEEEALTYYAKLNENIKTYATGGSGPSNSVALGEAAIGVGYIQFGIQLAEQGYHLSISMPEEGTGLEISAEGVVAGCKNLEAAQCLMDFLTSVEGQQLAEASGLYVFPCNPNAHISEKITQYEGTKLVDLDYQWSAANRDRLVEAWDALISK